jgi:hypothetical protein
MTQGRTDEAGQDRGRGATSPAHPWLPRPPDDTTTPPPALAGEGFLTRARWLSGQPVGGSLFSV